MTRGSLTRRAASRRGLLGLALLLSLALLAAACGGGGQTAGGSEQPSGQAPSEASAGPVVITIGIDADPPNLDPAGSTARVDRYVQNNIFDKLYDIDEHMNIVPDLAAALPDISEDGKVYTIPIRQGVNFSDGTPVNADAVVFNLERYLDPSSPRASELSSVEKVEKVDDYTVRITLKAPFAPLLYTLTDRAGMIGSPAAIQKEGADFQQNPVGSGPFVFVSRIKGDQIVLKKNPNYWKPGLPKADEIIWKVVTDENVKVVNLKAGQLDIINTVPAQSVADLSSNPDFKVVSNASLGFQGFFLNVTQPPFDNVYLRRAVDEAIDRQALVNVVFQDTAVPGYGPFGPTSPAAAASGQVPAPNLDQAKADLAKGGKPDGFSFTFKTATSPVNQQVAQVVQNMLAKVGIQMEIQQEEFGTLLDECDNHEFQACALGWSGRPDPDGNIYSWLYTGGGLNDSGYSNKDVDQLLDEARVVADMSQRVQLYAQAMQIVHQDVPYVYLWFPKDIMAYKAQVQGFVLYPDGMIRAETITK
ncbi:MAG: ABC transporter substrate-binding protein [Clostridia bacterium]|nr:ABC transporter substrate-binding protein [Clostridia bacterium]